MTSGRIRDGQADPPGRARGAAAACLLAAAIAGCAPRPLVVRAVRARGGPLEGVVREVEAEMEAGFPGRWRLRTAFLVPDRYAATVFTSGEPDHYLFDGATARAFVGERPVVVDAGARAPLRTLARFTAVVNLDALLLPGVAVTPLSAPDVPAGAVAGVAVVFADDGSRYRLGFDGRDLLVRAAGPIELPPLGPGEIAAAFADFRRVRGRLLPYRVDYVLGGRPLGTERTLAACPDPPGLTAAAFREPAALPACPAAEGAMALAGSVG